MFSSDIDLPENGRWTRPDAEFTSSTSSIHAVWPSLRHGLYKWKVVADTPGVQFSFVQHQIPKTYTDFHCNSPNVLRCGETSVSLYLSHMK